MVFGEMAELNQPLFCKNIASASASFWDFRGTPISKWLKALLFSVFISRIMSFHF